MPNNLILQTPTYDTATPKFGAGALNGGYSISPVGLLPPTGGQFTLEAWVKGTNQSGVAQVIMGSAGTGYLGTAANNTLTFQCSLTIGLYSLVTSINILDGAWHHVAAVVGNSNVSLYHNGALAQTSPAGNYTFSLGGTSSVGVRVQSGGSPANVWTGAIDEAVFWPFAKYTAPFTPPAAPYTGNEGMAALWHLDGNGLDSAIPVVIAPNDASISYSPYNWAVAAGFAKTINPGAYLSFQFSGQSCTLNFDGGADLAPFPEFWYSIDGQPSVQATYASTVTLTLPNSTKYTWPMHTLDLVFKSASAFVDRWAPQYASITLLNVTLLSGAAVAPRQAPAKNVLIYGDASAEGTRGVAIVPTASDPDGSDAKLGWAYMQKSLLGVAVGVVGFNGSSLLAGAAGGVPVASVSYNQLWGGAARSFTPAPDLVVVALGQSDAAAASGTFMPQFEGFLNAVLGTVGPCPVAVLMPFSGAQAAAIQAAIAAINDPRLHYFDTTGFFNTAYSSDGVNPFGVANIASIAPRIANLLAPLLLPPPAVVGIPHRWTHS